MKTPAQPKGFCYLLHFTQPYRHASHYLGATGLPIAVRLQSHRDGVAGRPAKLIAALLRSGGDFVLARVWETSTRAEAFQLELKLKRQGGHSRKCPICRGGANGK